MGLCFSVIEVATQDNSSSSQNIGDKSYTGESSLRKWKAKLTAESAKSIHENDGTVPKNCTSEILELRVHLGEPVLLKPFLRYAFDLHKIKLVSCWADILEFRCVREEDCELQVQLAKGIYERYINADSVDSMSPSLLPTEKAVWILTRISADGVKLMGLASDLFDSFLHLVLAKMYTSIFVPYKVTVEYKDTLKLMKSSYNHVNANDFVYYEELGRGGFGCVVHCRKKSTGVHYAMKIQTKKGLLKSYAPNYSRVTCELEALASCNNPFIVGLEYAFQTSSLVMLAMEMGLAGTLSDALALCEDYKMCEERVVFYAAQIVLALAHIHKMGLIYRDLKPSNVLLCADGYIKLADLGGVVDVGGKVLGSRFTEKEAAIFSEAGEEREVSAMSRFLSRDVSVVVTEAFKSPTLRSAANSVYNPSYSQGGSSAPVSAAALGSGSGSAAVANAMSPSSVTIDPTTGLPASFQEDHSLQPSTLQRANSIMGTGGYMAPEMLVQVFFDAKTASAGYTSMVDLWSLGVTMFKLLTGRVPFNDDQIASLVTFLRRTGMDRPHVVLTYLSDYTGFLEDLLGKQASISSGTKSILIELFRIDYTLRIGHGPNGWKTIEKHECFKSIDWRKLEKKLIVPVFIPDEVVKSYHHAVDGEGGAGTGSVEAPKAHESFFDMVMCSRRKTWDMSVPTAEHQIYFNSWHFVDRTVLEDEVRLEEEEEEHQLQLLLEDAIKQPEPTSGSSFIANLPALPWISPGKQKISPVGNISANPGINACVNSNGVGTGTPASSRSPIVSSSFCAGLFTGTSYNAFTGSSVVAAALNAELGVGATYSASLIEKSCDPDTMIDDEMLLAQIQFKCLQNNAAPKRSVTRTEERQTSLEKMTSYDGRQ